jgi:hypothetical protein
VSIRLFLVTIHNSAVAFDRFTRDIQRPPLSR